VADWLHYEDNTEIPDNIRIALSKPLMQADWDAFVARHPSMSENEKSSFLGRIERLKDAMQTPSGLHDLWRGQRLM
jgi:hypothetical protein